MAIFLFLKMLRILGKRERNARKLNKGACCQYRICRKWIAFKDKKLITRNNEFGSAFFCSKTWFIICSEIIVGCHLVENLTVK